MMHPLLNIAISAARQAGDMIARHVDQLDRVTIYQKNKTSFYTDVDIKSEQLIIQTIHKAYPEHGIIAEESGSHGEDRDIVWIIDPLDGTRNFIHGVPFFAVSIAVQVKQRIEHAVIYDPIRHECFAASRGAGARLNDRRMRVSKQTQLGAAFLGSSFSLGHVSSARGLSVLGALSGHCASFRLSGSCALDLAYVAAGRFDGVWEQGVSPWDTAAGCLLVKEAGGLVADMDGGEDFLKKGDLIASTPKLFKSLFQTIVPAMKG